MNEQQNYDTTLCFTQPKTQTDQYTLYYTVYVMLFEEEYGGDKQISLFCKLCEAHVTSRKCG